VSADVVQMRRKAAEPTDRQLVEACAALLLCLNPGQEVRLSQEHLHRLLELARAGLAERQTRPA
jgi:hypothetical protein